MLSHSQTTDPWISNIYKLRHFINYEETRCLCFSAGLTFRVNAVTVASTAWGDYISQPTEASISCKIPVIMFHSVMDQTMEAWLLSHTDREGPRLCDWNSCQEISLLPKRLWIFHYQRNSFEFTIYFGHFIITTGKTVGAHNSTCNECIVLTHVLVAILVSWPWFIRLGMHW